jgi:hypothetical protein
LSLLCRRRKGQGERQQQPGKPGSAYLRRPVAPTQVTGNATLQDEGSRLAGAPRAD